MADSLAILVTKPKSQAKNEEAKLRISKTKGLSSQGINSDEQQASITNFASPSNKQ